MEFNVWKSSTNGQWYWHAKAANGKVIADGGEGYYNKQDCLNMVYKIQAEAASAKVYNLTPQST